MKHITSFVLLFLTVFFTAQSAQITGIVKDATSGQPLELAAVFIAGTTYGVNTQADGSFTLKYTPSGSSQLVVAHLGYQTYTKNIGDLASDKPLNIDLQVKATQLSTVSVVGYDSNRKKNMADFIFCFLGDSEFGRSCTILNPNVLHLVRKHMEGKIGQDALIAYADSDLIIENKLLGYTIRYTLESFYLTRFSATFKGYPLFLDNLSNMKKQDRILENRERAYQGSQMHFFRSLFTKSLQQDGFKVYKIDKEPHLPTIAHYFGLMADTVMVPEPNQHMVQTEKPLNLEDFLYFSGQMAALQYNRPFEIRYTLNGEDKAYRINNLYFDGMRRNLGQQTTIGLIEESPLIFFPNGALKDAGSLTTIGYWSFKKVGEILPWDYLPPKTAKHVVTLH